MRPLIRAAIASLLAAGAVQADEALRQQVIADLDKLAQASHITRFTLTAARQIVGGPGRSCGVGG